MNGKNKKTGLIFMIIGGLALLGVLVGMIAHLSDTLIRICGGVLAVSMVVVAYNTAKVMKSGK